MNRLAANDPRNVRRNINVRKTKIMRIGSRCYEPLILNGKEMEDVNKTDTAVVLHARQGMKNILDFKMRHKLCIFHASIKTVHLYGSEIWRTAHNIFGKPQVFNNKFLRRKCKIFWPNCISNHELLRLTNLQQPISNEIACKKLTERVPKLSDLHRIVGDGRSLWIPCSRYKLNEK